MRPVKGFIWIIEATKTSGYVGILQVKSFSSVISFKSSNVSISINDLFLVFIHYFLFLFLFVPE
jgi:hypothetical protein